MQARQEHLQHNRQTSSLRPVDAHLEDWLFRDLEQLLNDETRTENELLPPIYWKITEHIRLRGGEFIVADLAYQDHFEATVSQQGLQCLFDTLRKAIASGKKDDRMAVFNYSMCFYHGVNG